MQEGIKLYVLVGKTEWRQSNYRQFKYTITLKYGEQNYSMSENVYVFRKLECQICSEGIKHERVTGG